MYIHIISISLPVQQCLIFVQMFLFLVQRRRLFWRTRMSHVAVLVVKRNGCANSTWFVQRGNLNFRRVWWLHFEAVSKNVFHTCSIIFIWFTCRFECFPDWILLVEGACACGSSSSDWSRSPQAAWWCAVVMINVEDEKTLWEALYIMLHYISNRVILWILHTG